MPASESLAASSRVRVIKLGGSLLDWPELAVRFRRWLARQSAAVQVVVVGGGPVVEGLRVIDRAQHLSVEASHWLAIRAMGLTAEVAGQLLPGAQVVDDLEEVRRADTGAVLVLDVERFLRAEERSGQHKFKLPHGWDVTSDSIAALVAQTLRADELVLLKSTLPEESDVLSAAERGYVDAHFPAVAAGLSIRAVDLRSAQGSDEVGTDGEFREARLSRFPDARD